MDPFRRSDRRKKSLQAVLEGLSCNRICSLKLRCSRYPVASLQPTKGNSEPSMNHPSHQHICNEVQSGNQWGTNQIYEQVLSQTCLSRPDHVPFVLLHKVLCRRSTFAAEGRTQLSRSAASEVLQPEESDNALL